METGFGGDCPLYLCPMLLLFYTRLPVSVVCGPVLATTSCGFSHLRWELKEVTIAGCLACLFFKTFQRKYFLYLPL